MAYLPFPEITSVLNSANVLLKRTEGNSLYYVCPFCDDKAGHMNVVPEKKMFRCPRCGNSGGIVKLVMLLQDCDKSTAAKWLNDFSKNPKNNLDASELKKIQKAYSATSLPIADQKTLDKTYRSMLELLSLSSLHFGKLTQRGLDESYLYNSYFRSVPQTQRETQNIAAELIKKGCGLNGVPGFYKENQRWQFNTISQGYFVPFVNAKGLMTGLQIRLDEPMSHQKYKAFSSTTYSNGVKAKFQAHYTTPGYYPKKIFLTEGALKADVACFLTDKVCGKSRSFLAIGGVNNIEALKKSLLYLKKKGVTTVVDAFDMDKEGSEDAPLNINVKSAVNKIKKMCEELGLTWVPMTWPSGKGIDDYLLDCQKNALY